MTSYGITISLTQAVIIILVNLDAAAQTDWGLVAYVGDTRYVADICERHSDVGDI